MLLSTEFSIIPFFYKFILFFKLRFLHHYSSKEGKKQKKEMSLSFLLDEPLDSETFTVKWKRAENKENQNFKLKLKLEILIGADDS